MRENCFANLGKDCNALIEKACIGCKFYTPKNKVKNNIFYPWSFKNKEEYKKALLKYKKGLIK